MAGKGSALTQGLGEAVPTAQDWALRRSRYRPLGVAPAAEREDPVVSRDTNVVCLTVL